MWGPGPSVVPEPEGRGVPVGQGKDPGHLPRPTAREGGRRAPGAEGGKEGGRLAAAALPRGPGRAALR